MAYRAGVKKFDPHFLGKARFSQQFAVEIIICARGGTGRRAGFRFQSERVQVQFLSGAPKPQKPDKHWLLGLFILRKYLADASNTGNVS